MLQNIRERLTGPVALLFLALISIPFVFVGMNSPLIGAGFAAKVDGEEIPLPNFERAWQTEIQSNPDILNAPAVYQTALRQQLLDQMILEQVINNYIDDTGVRATDKMVTDIIQANPQFQDEDGFSMEIYQGALAGIGVTPAMYEASENRRLRQVQMQRAVGFTAFVTPAEYRRYLNLYAEQRVVTIATIPFDGIEEGIEISEEDIVAFYEENPERFQTEESVDINFIEIRRDELAAAAELPEEEIQQYYNDVSNRYLQDEQRRARHILIPFGEDEAAAEEEATALTARIKAGEPFEDLARQYSKDGMTASNGGDLGPMLHSQNPDAFGDAIFSMRNGEVRGPVRTDFGFHVIRLDEIIAGGPLPLDQVRAEVERELRDRKAEARVRELTNSIQASLFDASDIAEMAATVGVELQTATGFTRAGGEPFGTNQAVIDAVFQPASVEEMLISDVVEIDANRSAVFQVSAHSPSILRPLDEVRPQISGALSSARAQEIIQQRAVDMQARLEAGEDINTLAEEFGATVAPTSAVPRVDQNYDTRLLGTIFASQKPSQDTPTIGSSALANGDFAVFSLQAVIPGRPEAIPLADRDARKQELSRESGIADLTAFLTELQSNADIVRSEDVTQNEPQFQ